MLHKVNSGTNLVSNISLLYLHKNANYTDLIHKSSGNHTFRNGITNGLRGKLVASCSWAWNSSMDIVEFWNKKRLKLRQKSTYLYTYLYSTIIISLSYLSLHTGIFADVIVSSLPHKHMTLVWEGTILGTN